MNPKANNYENTKQAINLFVAKWRTEQQRKILKYFHEHLYFVKLAMTLTTKVEDVMNFYNEYFVTIGYVQLFYAMLHVILQSFLKIRTFHLKQSLSLSFKSSEIVLSTLMWKKLTLLLFYLFSMFLSV